MIFFETCCCCVDLETGGKLWGIFGVIFGVLSLFKVVSAIIIGFKVSIIAGTFGLLTCVLTIASIFSSILLIKGVREKSHKRIQPARVVAIIEYISAIIYVIYLTRSCDYHKITKLYGLNLHDETKVAFAVLILGFAVVDFMFRFTVIDSLYYIYKQEVNPKFIV